MRKTLFLSLLLVIAATCNDIYADFGASGYTSDAQVGPSAAAVASFNRIAQPLAKFHECETSGLGSNARHIWRIQVVRFAEPFGYVDPEAIQITVSDAGRSAERIRMRVTNLNDPTGKVYSQSASSPAVAHVGIPVNHGDIVKVIVDYPGGFTDGNSASAYVICWTLNNTGWIME